jgi:hypothetical protein
VGAVVLESWEKHLHNFQFETNRYPDPAGWMRTLQQRGVHVVCWTTASIWTGDPTHEHARDHGYLVRQADGSDYITRWLENGRKMDFRIPAARDWWRDLHQPLIKMGVGGFKTDGGEHMPDPWFHNEHPFPYQRATLDAYAAAGRTGITFARSANPLCAGNSTFWGGDQHADWSNLAAVVHGGLSAAWSGFFYWSHDVGGYTGVAEKNLYLRWLQIGAFSPMMQLHGIPAREPWHYDRETLDLARGYFKVREQLQPYLVDLAREAREQGHPMWRPLAWAYPHDENTWSLGDQFLLGPDLLVAPVLSSNETRSIYVPEGEWLDLWTQATIRGPTRLTTQVERAAIPVYARAESAARWRQLLRAVPRPEPSPFRMELAGPRNERGLVPEQRYVADGGVETVAYTLHNQSPVPAVGTLTLKLPPGFTCEPNHHTFELAPGTSTERSFALATPRGLEPGSYTIQGLCRIGNLAAKTPKVHVIRSPAWKVLGLFPLAMGAPHELDGKRPDLNARWTVREGDLLWQDLPAEKLGADGWVDLSWLTTREHLATAYAFTTVASPGTRRAVIKSGSGDALTIWLNGQEISRREVCRNPERDEDAADVVLRGGVNTILVRHSRGLAPSGFYFRLADQKQRAARIVEGFDPGHGAKPRLHALEIQLVRFGGRHRKRGQPLVADVTQGRFLHFHGQVIGAHQRGRQQGERQGFQSLPPRQHRHGGKSQGQNQQVQAGPAVFPPRARQRRQRGTIGRGQVQLDLSGHDQMGSIRGHLKTLHVGKGQPGDQLHQRSQHALARLRIRMHEQSQRDEHHQQPYQHPATNRALMPRHHRPWAESAGPRTEPAQTGPR